MTYGSAHYWASEDLNTTGENVGITLDSMCDIIMANDVTSGNTVVFIPGDIEHGQKGHFALGEGGGGSAEIDASIYQVVVGDGEGNGIGAQWTNLKLLNKCLIMLNNYGKINSPLLFKRR